MNKPNKGMDSVIDFVKENKVKTGIAAAVAVVVIGVAVFLGVRAGKGAEPASGETQSEVAAETQTVTESVTETEIPLEEDAYPEINALMEQYYQAVSDGDMDTIQSLVKTFDQETLIYLQKRSAYIDSYQNIKCYTKPGPVDGSYVVYAYYEVKFQEMETLVPGISPFLVYQNADGSCYIHEGEVDETTNEYLEEISAQDDVVDLMNSAQVQFNDAVVEDEELNNYLAQMKKDLEVEVGEALAEAEAAGQQEEETTDTGAVLASGGEVRATDVVNVRASDSENADKIGKVQTGEVLKLIESKANGWSKVEYEGKEAYIKSEFLEAVSADNGEGDEQADNSEGQQADNSQSDNAQADTGSSSQNGVSTDIPTSGTVTVADTVNIRKSASESADRIGVCYQGGKLEILMQQADGWTKVKFEGQTGYVKTEVLKIMK